MKLILLAGILCLTPVLGNKYSEQELKALTEFSSLVELPHEYMKENDYLINWIRSASVPHRSEEFNLEKAKDNLVSTLAWRKQHDIDNILSEDFSKMYKVYPPLGKPILDKEGNTVYKFTAEDLDLTKIPKKMIDRFKLYLFSILERTARGTRDNKCQYATWIIDARHYNPDLHFGSTGKAIYPEVFAAIETHYPYLMKRLIFINAPISFLEAGNLIKSAISPRIREEFKIFGDNEAEWVAYLESFMKKDQISKFFLESKYTKEEAKALSEFSILVESELLEDYMKQDNYLINWIKSAQTPSSIKSKDTPQEFDLTIAKENLEKNLAWRKTNGIDSILNEDFSDMRQIFLSNAPVQIDKEGGTICTFSFDNLDLTKLSGEGIDRFTRYAYFILENIAKITRDYRSQHTTCIIDARRFNPDLHFSPNVQSIYSSFYGPLEEHYPSLLKSLIYINAPASFSEAGNYIKSTLNPKIRNGFKIFGNNETEWVDYLEKFMYQDQIPKSFFGNKYTQQELKALDKFSSLVKSELPQEYMKQNDYLINWIRSVPLQYSLNTSLPQEFDLKKAKQALEDNLAWRKKYNIDNIFNENFSDMYKQVYPPFKRGVITKDGGTLHTLNFKNFDISKLSEKSLDRYSLYCAYILEKIARDTRDNGSPYTTVLVNAQHFDPDLHSGPNKQTAWYRIWFQTMEAHYPLMIKRLIYVNAPAGISEVTDIIKSSVSTKFKDEFKVFGQNETEWLAYLEKFIDKNHIPESFLGNKYTKEEARALSEFSALVKPELTQEYMTKDDYLIKWVRSAVEKRTHAEKFNLNKAKENLEKCLAWRKQNDMNNILEEDFVDLQKVYPYIGTPIVDRDGGTVYMFDFGKFDPTKIAETERITRFLYYLLEKISTTTENFRSPYTSIVVDARRYNPSLHFNSKTKTLYSTFYESIEANYPSLVKRIVYINAPESFSDISKIAECYLSPKIKNEFKVFGENEEEWATYLKKFMDPTQIPKSFLH